MTNSLTNSIKKNTKITAIFTTKNLQIDVTMNVIGGTLIINECLNYSLLLGTHQFVKICIIFNIT